jgi:hypothetical protein
VSNLVNIATSQAATAERYLKLYRELHNLYLKDDFVNFQDFGLALSELNLRIDTLEQQLISQLKSIEIGLSNHVHIVPQAPAGALPSNPPLVPPYISALAATKPVPQGRSFADNRNLILQATGPAITPL